MTPPDATSFHPWPDHHTAAIRMTAMRETPTSIILTLRRHGGESVEIAWKDIEHITAFKQDLFNPQIVVLELGTSTGTWEVDAGDCGGFEIFSTILVRSLPGMPAHETWWPTVTDPLGRQEDVVLYRAPATQR